MNRAFLQQCVIGLAVLASCSCGEQSPGQESQPSQEFAAAQSALGVAMSDPTPENLESAVIACSAAPQLVPGCLEAVRALQEMHKDDSDPRKLTKIQSFEVLFLEANGKTEQALALLESIVEVRRKFFGEPSAELAESLNWLGNFLLRNNANTSNARDTFARMLTNWEAANGPESVAVAQASLNLAVAEEALGNFLPALELMQKSLSAMESALGPDHAHVALVLDQLAGLETNLGHYTDALLHYERALDLMEKAHGLDSMPWARTLHNQGRLLIRMGEFQSALSPIERAWAIYRREHGDDDDQTAVIASNLAEAQMHLNDLDGAEETIRLAVDGARAAENDPILALSLIINGNLNLQRQAPTAAKEKFKEAHSLLISSFGTGHPWCTHAIEGLARAALVQDDPAGAVALAQESLLISRTMFGRHHPRVAENLVLLAEAKRRLGDHTSALNAAIEAETIGREHLELALPVVDERLALHLAETRVKGTDIALRMIDDLSEDQLHKIWDQIVRSRAIVFDEMAWREHELRATASPEIKQLRHDFDTARRALAEMAVHAAAADTGGSRSADLEQAFDEVERLERLLAATGCTYSRITTSKRTGISEVIKAIEAIERATAAVAFVKINEDSLGAISKPASEAYIALILGSGRTVHARHLGPAFVIDEAVQTWRDLLEIRGLDRKLDEERLRTSGNALRTLIWDPVSDLVEGTEEVYIIPDGAIHLVSFEALPARSGLYLLEDGPLFRRVTAERDVISTESEGPAPLGGVLFACGGPAFGPMLSPDGVDRWAGQDLVFGALPAAQEEVESIERLWQEREEPAERRILVAHRATEARFVQLIEGAQTVHIATHAFFINKESLDEGRLRESPLLRSGLALAGANQAAATSGRDGILTAAEISSLDLEYSNWVVLSACGTGLGDVQHGEGVLGLQRAFRIAGAQTLIVSLWPVEDQESMLWMKRLYNHGLEGNTAAEAIRLASLDSIAAQRTEGRSTHPKSWGAFVAVGSR